MTAAQSADLLSKHQANISRLAQQFGITPNKEPAIANINTIRTPFDLDGFKTRLNDIAQTSLEVPQHEETISDGSLQNLLAQSSFNAQSP